MLNDILKKENGIYKKVLWTNPNPTSAFAEQDVTLSSDDYDILEVFFAYNTSNTDYIQSERTIKGKGCIIGIIGYGNPNTSRRKFDYVNDTKLHFSSGISTTGSNGDNYVVPVYIIGYKTKLF